MTGAGSSGQGPADGMDPEDGDRCPICLGVVSPRDLAMPDSCCHIFCLRCLLTWAEVQMTPSCPVDRRPFTHVFKWDGTWSCVQVPVREHAPSEEPFCCRTSKDKVCLKIKPNRKLRCQKRKFPANTTKTKGTVTKCNSEKASAVSHRQLRGSDCCFSWSPPLYTAVPPTPQESFDPAWMTPIRPDRSGSTPSKSLLGHRPWLSSVAPMPVNGTSRLRFSGWTRNAFLSGLGVSAPYGPGPSLLEGVSFAITCPRGGGKRGSKTFTSKTSTKEAGSLSPRRSGRNSQTPEQAQTSEPASAPRSSSSDSDSSNAQPDEAPPTRRTKLITNRKASGKRKGQRRKRSRSAEEEEEEEEVVPEGHEETEQTSKRSDDEDLPDRDTGEEKEVEDEGRSEEEEPTSTSSHEDRQSENMEELDSPTDAHNGMTDDLVSPSCDGQTEQDNNGIDPIEDPCGDSDDDTTASRDNPVQSGPSSPEEIEDEKKKSEKASVAESPGEPSEPMLKDASSPEPSEPSVENHSSALGSPEPTMKETSSALGSPEPSEHTMENPSSAVGCEDPSEPILEDPTSKDDTSEVPMDCSSPISENGQAEILEPLQQNQGPGADPPQAESQVMKEDSCKDQNLDKNQEKTIKQRRSRFHSACSTWSPKRDTKREPSRTSRSRERDDSPTSNHSQSRSRGGDKDRDRNYSKRERSRDRRKYRSRSRSRSRSWSRSRSKSRSRSRSRSRTRSYRRGPSSERSGSKTQSPQRKERRGAWKSGPEGRRYQGGSGHFENGSSAERSPDRQARSGTPEWVAEKTEGRNRDLSFGGGSHWDDHRSRSGNRGRGGFDRDRGSGRGGGRNFYNHPEESSDNRWQSRNNFSGTGAVSGNDSYSRGGARRKEVDPSDSMVDRSGWSSASSWAVRRKLPADVQDYYSKKERGGPGSWNRSEEEQPAAVAEPPKSEPPLQAVTGSAPVPVVNLLPPPPPPPQLTAPYHHYPLQGPRGALPVSLQPAAPYPLPPQVHLHPTVPLLQVPAGGAQGLPPPPPPPPPMQQGSQTSAALPDGHMTQMSSTMVGYGKPGLLPTPSKAGGMGVTQVQAALSHVVASSTTQPANNKAQADSSKKEKKQQIQEKAVNEVKTAIKPFYQKKEITKDEYKEIVRKAVEKVCHSKSGEVNSDKVANLVKAYVDKYKRARKK